MENITNNLIEAPKVKVQEESGKTVNLEDIYTTYCLWKSLPALLKYPPRDKQGISPSSKQFCEQMGIDDEQILELVNIKTQTQFAERFGISFDTTTNWNKTTGVRNSLTDIKKWARSLSKNVITALYNKAIRGGSSFEVKLWFQLVEEWEEKGKLAHEGLGDIHFNILLKQENGDKPRPITDTVDGVEIVN